MSAALDSLKLGPRRSVGLRPMANYMGVLPLEVIWIFLTDVALRINWAGVLCVSTSAKRNFLNSRTPISARFGHGVCGPVGILFTLCIR